MPELPDVEVYLRALGERIVGEEVGRVRVASPFVVRSYEPPIRAIEGKRVRGLRRLGKRIVWELDDELFVVIHLMIAGRFRYEEKSGAKIPGKVGLAAFDFPEATLILTEASKKKRASIHVVRGEAALAEHDPGGIEVLSSTLADFRAALTRENHTLKRTLTDPRCFSGIGNAYSDEILHRARLSPITWSTRLSDEEIGRLWRATRAVLSEWLEKLDRERAGGFPEKVTAFRPDMAVHGRYREKCPDCGSPVQRIVRGENEFNYCATCQTGGKLLADRALSRLLHRDWPKTLEELEEMKRARKAPGSGLQAPGSREEAGSGLRAPGSGHEEGSRLRAPGSRKGTAADEKGARRKKKAGARVILFAHGAGAASSSEWMSGWAERLGAFGKVVRFDYPYMAAGKKRPDAHDVLLAAHRSALRKASLGHRGPIVLAGKSLGSRIGCHLALEEQVAALVCLGYPLQSPAGKLRDEVLLALRTPILFVQGTRDALCPLDTLEEVRRKMTAPSELYVVDDGDHSLCPRKTWLKQHGQSQADVDAAIARAIGAFFDKHAG